MLWVKPLWTIVVCMVNDSGEIDWEGLSQSNANEYTDTTIGYDKPLCIRTNYAGGHNLTPRIILRTVTLARLATHGLSGTNPAPLQAPEAPPA